MNCHLFTSNSSWFESLDKNLFVDMRFRLGICQISGKKWVQQHHKFIKEYLQSVTSTHIQILIVISTELIGDNGYFWSPLKLKSITVITVTGIFLITVTVTVTVTDIFFRFVQQITVTVTVITDKTGIFFITVTVTVTVTGIWKITVINIRYLILFLQCVLTQFDFDYTLEKA